MRQCQLTILVFMIVCAAPTAQAAEPSGQSVDALINNLTHPDRHIRTEALNTLDTLGIQTAVPALIELLRFKVRFDTPLSSVLERLAGVQLGDDWAVWAEWLQQHEDIRAHDGFLAWKAALFSRLDPNFLTLLSAGLPYRIRLEEIAWGGVRKDGIPALTNPKHIQPDEADYLTPQELVFGVSINSDHRAYPLRILDWHEMFNDVVGGKPVTLAY
jgi:hypothetical protein